MKKLFIVFAIAALASCNNDKTTESTTETVAPTTVTPADTTVVAPVATDAPTTTATTAH